MIKNLPAAAFFFCSFLTASAGVTFNVEFEAGSKWFTEPWSEAARTEFGAFFTDLGQLFDSDATVFVRVTDDATGGVFASAGATWSTKTTVEGRDGLFSAPSLWSIIVKGVDENGGAVDANINWNMDVAALYGNDSGRLIGNIRGLARHEMHHAFGSSSSLFQSSSYDPRGKPAFASLLDSLYRDLNDAPLIGAYNPANQQFTVNNYVLAADWATAQNASGLYVEARNIRGEIVKMPPISFNGQIDFSHVKGIAYVSDHPSWRNYEDTDRNFLRALGYPLTVDASLDNAVPALDFKLSGTAAELKCDTQSTHFYRVKTSRDLIRWSLRPQGRQGTNGPLTLTVPLNDATDRKMFFQIFEIP